MKLKAKFDTAVWQIFICAKNILNFNFNYNKNHFNLKIKFKKTFSFACLFIEIG